MNTFNVDKNEPRLKLNTFYEHFLFNFLLLFNFMKLNFLMVEFFEILKNFCDFLRFFWGLFDFLWNSYAWNSLLVALHFSFLTNFAVLSGRFCKNYDFWRLCVVCFVRLSLLCLLNDENCRVAIKGDAWAWL